MFVWLRPLRLRYYKALAGSLIDNRSFNDELPATKVSFGWTDMQQQSHQWQRILATFLHGDDFAIGPKRRHQRVVQFFFYYAPGRFSAALVLCFQTTTSYIIQTRCLNRVKHQN